MGLSLEWHPRRMEGVNQWELFSGSSTPKILNSVLDEFVLCQFPYVMGEEMAEKRGKRNRLCHHYEEL